MSTLLISCLSIAVLFVVWACLIYLSNPGQPKGLWVLALSNTGERFGYYTMLAVFVYFLQANFGFKEGLTSTIFSTFLGFVYFLPLIGGILADLFGYSKMVVCGIFVMFAGYVLLALPLGGGTVGIIAMGGALLFICLGTGLFKGNLQVMVGDLYNSKEYASERDSGFSLFYMAINLGAMFAPTAAIKVMEWAQTSLGASEADSYHYAFGVACVSLIASILIYFFGKPTFKHVTVTKKKEDKKEAANADVQEISKSETKERIVCLILVFAVVLFFWMAFHQNGLTLSFFARDYTATSSTGIEQMMFDVTNLCALIFVTFGIITLFTGKKAVSKAIGGGLLIASIIYLVWNYNNLADNTEIKPAIFQHFNACFVVMLTPIIVGIFGWLAKKGKEPKAPAKIGVGMLIAGGAYLLMTVFSIGLPAPAYAADGTNLHMANVTPNLLVSTYFILTVAELFLSPIGISFVTKVAPPKLKGTMMGGWFVSTALGNFLVQIPGYLWGMDLYIVWTVLFAICLVAALFIFAIIKKLNKVA